MIHCTEKVLPAGLQVAAAYRAIEENPNNAPAMHGFAAIASPEFLAVMVTKYWSAKGVKLGVGFMESTPNDVANKIVLYLNAWSKYGNVEFYRTTTDPQVRITRSEDGYWSYLGTDILSIPKNQPTMCLQGFTMNTPEREWARVPPHEAGHTLAMPHEHMRKSIVDRIDPDKAIEYFRRTQGWSPATTRSQVLTPLSESSLMGTTEADPTSIMAYQLPGSIMRDGEPIPGGSRINEKDGAFLGKIYPKPGGPVEPTDPGTPPVNPARKVAVESLVVSVDGVQFTASGTMKPVAASQEQSMSHVVDQVDFEKHAAGLEQAALSDKFCAFYATAKPHADGVLAFSKGLQNVPFIGPYVKQIVVAIGALITGLDMAATAMGCGASDTDGSLT